MPGQYDSQGRKWDESDFELQVVEMAEGKNRDFAVNRGRVFDVPTRHRTVGSGAARKSIAVCIHGRLITHSCATCEWEAEKLTESGGVS